MPFQVTVYSYADDGTRTPAAGASVTGAALPTGAAGHTMVTARGRDRRAAGDPRAGHPLEHGRGLRESADRAKCPDAHGERIFGSDARRPRSDGTRGWDAITAGGGDDLVDITRGGGTASGAAAAATR